MSPPSSIKRYRYIVPYDRYLNFHVDCMQLIVHGFTSMSLSSLSSSSSSTRRYSQPYWGWLQIYVLIYITLMNCGRPFDNMCTAVDLSLGKRGRPFSSLKSSLQFAELLLWGLGIVGGEGVFAGTALKYGFPIRRGSSFGRVHSYGSRCLG